MKRSADSTWVHRASGVRGALLHILEKIETDRYIPAEEEPKLIDSGFYILEQSYLQKTRVK